MRRAWDRAWAAMDRPVGRAVRGPRARVRRRDRRGIAMLVVVAALMILTTLLTDISFSARVRVLTAAHERDELQAYYLAQSGINIYRLVLMANRQISRNSMFKPYLEAAGIPPGDALWKMVPMINTGLMRMLFVADEGDVSEAEAEEFAQSGEVSAEVSEQSREEGGGRFSGRNFLDFPGDFVTEVRGEDCRANVNLFATASSEQVTQETAVGQVIYGLMSGDENLQWLRERNLEPWDLISNLRDWVDADNMRSTTSGGYEDDLYNRLDSPYLAKNARFDTPSEIRLVDGWQDEVFDKFGGELSIYGGGKIDINCASDEMLKGLFRSNVTTPLTESDLDRLISDFHTQLDTAQGAITNGRQLKSWLEGLGYGVRPELPNLISSSATFFTLTSTGQSGGATVRITAVVEYSTDEGKVLYWRVD